MLSDHKNFRSKDGTNIFVYYWYPDGNSKVKGIVQIAHGMAETAARYERLAHALTSSGFIVYANDHRGHGKTAGCIENLGFLADKDGFEWIVKDSYQLSEIIKKEHPGLPLFMLGHSMGSFVTLRYIMHYGNEINGAILSGTGKNHIIVLSIMSMIAKCEIVFFGLKKKSYILNKLIFGYFNIRFKPSRTDFDWLNRDNEEVDKYINNPYCGTVFTAEFFYDYIKSLLPIYIFSGGNDPVGNFGKGVTKVFCSLKEAGINDVSMKLYPGARHETLNEINRDDVMKDVIQWLVSKV